MNTYRSFQLVFFVLFALGCSSAPPVEKSSPEDHTKAEQSKPRLVVQITVDQLRGDLHRRYLDRMGDGGFRYLEEQGVVFEDANHAHATTETVVGHTTLATGAHPSIHGMVGNAWFDQVTGRLTYNIEDARYRLLSENAGVDKSTELDPTMAAAQTDGRSPATILSSTFSDELALHTNGEAKIFAVSVKDRGSVSMAGHAGKAFWFSKSGLKFVTSNYYYDAYPDWVRAFNDANPTAKYDRGSWTLLQEQSTYVHGDADDQPWEIDVPPYGRVFPHSFGDANGKLFGTLLTLSPAGDEMTLSFAKAIIDNENLGQDEVTDYLSVSFSSTDYVGHVFGNASLEAEDNLLRLDRVLAELFQHIDEKVGLENTIIVVSADHGGPEPPPQVQQLGIPGGYVNPEEWDSTEALKRLKQRFGVSDALIRAYQFPYVYLNHALIAGKGLQKSEVEEAIAAELQKLPGVHLAVTSSAIVSGRLPDTSLYRSIVNSHHVDRSGDIFVVFEPHWFINDFDGLEVASTHGSPWRYDTYVPIIFAGGCMTPARVRRPVWTVSVASTLSALTGANRPSGAHGELLSEVFCE